MFQKMCGEKGNAKLVRIVVLSILLIHIHTANAASYTVGDSSGWTFNVAGWEKGKPFKAGDTLIFKYVVGQHNTVVVDKASYDSCSVPAGAPTYSSGNDKLTLKKGPNYFICGIRGHCEAGMKIAPVAA
ncbi:UNVERIFIED_CONTAM: Chemocyanin [Sesamum radiatum]|uniref:Basic blue protein n=1 Tax=Sesamum radiatum TaxID=300843 RepID=A0AAW2MVJ1_SESRA